MSDHLPGNLDMLVSREILGPKIWWEGGGGEGSWGHAAVVASAPSMFIAHEPQIPSRHERRNVRVWSISFLILIRASRTMGPQSLRSME